MGSEEGAEHLKCVSVAGRGRDGRVERLGDSLFAMSEES